MVLMRSKRIVPALLALSWLVTACESPEDAARARFQERLKTSAPLTHAEMGQLVGHTLAAIGGRPARVRDGTTVRTLDAKAQAEVLAVLSGELPVSDAGVRQADNRILRGIEGPATPAHSELDAAQTLWIDVDTLLPHRFELIYSLPGFGDYAYDLIFTSQ